MSFWRGFATGAQPLGQNIAAAIMGHRERQREDEKEQKAKDRAILLQEYQSARQRNDVAALEALKPRLLESGFSPQVLDAEIADYRSQSLNKMPIRGIGDIMKFNEDFRKLPGYTPDTRQVDPSQYIATGRVDTGAPVPHTGRAGQLASSVAARISGETQAVQEGLDQNLRQQNQDHFAQEDRQRRIAEAEATAEYRQWQKERTEKNEEDKRWRFAYDEATAEDQIKMLFDRGHITEEQMGQRLETLETKKKAKQVEDQLALMKDLVQYRNALKPTQSDINNLMMLPDLIQELRDKVENPSFWSDTEDQIVNQQQLDIWEATYANLINALIPPQMGTPQADPAQDDVDKEVDDIFIEPLPESPAERITDPEPTGSNPEPTSGSALSRLYDTLNKPVRADDLTAPLGDLAKTMTASPRQLTPEDLAATLQKVEQELSVPGIAEHKRNMLEQYRAQLVKEIQALRESPASRMVNKEPIRPNFDSAGSRIVRDPATPDMPNVSYTDLPLDSLRPDEPIDLKTGTPLPEDVQVAYRSLPLDSLRPDEKLDVTFSESPEVIDIAPVELPLDDIAVDIVEETAKDFGPPARNDGSTLVSLKALTKFAKDDGKYQVIVDLNSNTSTLMKGTEFVKQYSIATADTTGELYGKKYFTPSGETFVKNKAPYGLPSDKKQNYGPYWMGLGTEKFESIGFHGPWEQEEKVVADGKFTRDGRLSHGCIRYRIEDLNDLAKYVKVGTRVYVIPFNKPDKRMVNK